MASAFFCDLGCLPITNDSTLTDHGGAARQRSLGPAEEVVHGLGVQVGLHQAGVDIYAPWYDHTALSFDHLHIPGDNEVFTHLSAEEHMNKSNGVECEGVVGEA